jgi:hypothetical protein
MVIRPTRQFFELAKLRYTEMAAAGTLKCLNCASPLRLLSNSEDSTLPLNESGTMRKINDGESDEQFYCCIPCHSYYATCNKCYFYTPSKAMGSIINHKELPTFAKHRESLRRILSAWISIAPLADLIVDYMTNGFCQLMSFPYVVRNISETPPDILTLWRDHAKIIRDWRAGAWDLMNGFVEVSDMHMYRFDTTYCHPTGYDGMRTHCWRCNDCGCRFSCSEK